MLVEERIQDGTFDMVNRAIQNHHHIDEVEQQLLDEYNHTLFKAPIREDEDGLNDPELLV